MKTSRSGSRVASFSTDDRLRSRVAFMVVISSPIGFPCSGQTTGGASPGPGGHGGNGRIAKSGRYGASPPAASPSRVSLVVSFPVAISAIVR